MTDAADPLVAFLEYCDVAHPHGAAAYIRVLLSPETTQFYRIGVQPAEPVPSEPLAPMSNRRRRLWAEG